MKHIILSLVCLLVFSCLALSCEFKGFAQTPVTGAIRGHVYEIGTELPLSGVSVTITNQVQGFTRTIRTNAQGNYFLEFLQPGNYLLEISFRGYEADPNSSAGEASVRVGRTEVVQAPAIGLRKVGTAGPMPPVPKDPTRSGRESQFVQMVNTINASRGESLSRRQLLALPIARGRAFDILAFLAPGVAPPPQAIGNIIGPGVGAGVGTSGQFSVNGLRSRANNFTVDGSDNNDEDIGVRRQGFTALLPQSIESLQEYQIITLLPEPQFGRNLGAQVNAISRPGEAAFHGTLYGFMTDRRLKARDPFDLTLTGARDKFPLTRVSDGAAVLLNGNPIELANPVGAENPYTRGQYGFVVGGPVGNKRTLFFGSFEHQDVNASSESNFAVPTVAERGLFNSGDTGLRVTVPNLQGQPVTQEIYPTSVTGDAIFSLFPLPNNPRGPYGLNTYTEILPARADGTIFSVKLDQEFKAFGRSHTLTGRYNFTDDNTTLPVTGEALFSSMQALVRAQNLSLYLNSATAARLANQMRFSYGRTRLRFEEVQRRLGFNDVQSLRLNKVQQLPLLKSRLLPNEPFLLNALILVNGTCPTESCGTTTPQKPRYSTAQPITTEEILGPLGQVIISGYSPVGVDVFNFPQRRVNNTFQYADTLIYNLRRHRLNTGVDLRRTQLNSRLERNFRPLAVFNGAPDLAPQFGFKAASQTGFHLGRDFAAAGAPTGFFQTLALAPDPTIGLRFWQNNFFFADQMRLTPDLTLTLGVRYELDTVPREVNRRIESTFTSAQVQKLQQVERGLNNGVSGYEQFLAGRTGIFRRDGNNLAPHLAFAWDPFGRGKTSVRGGYGLYFDQIPGAVISQSRSVFPNFLSVNLAGLLTTVEGGVSYFALNPACLGTATLSCAGLTNLNTYNARLGSDLVDFLLRLNEFTIPIQAKDQNPTKQTFPGGLGFVLPAAELKTPFSQHWALTVEREVKKDFLASFAYVGTKGTHLLRFATPNLGLNAIPVITEIAPRGFEPAASVFDVAPGPGFKRPSPLLGSFTSIESDANSTYHSLQLQLNKRFSHSLQFTTAYTWSHVIDEVSDLFDLAGARALPQNSFKRGAERGDANFDVRQRFVYSFIWELPLPKRGRWLSGWQLAGIGTIQTGQPYTILSGFDVNLDGNLTDRLNRTTDLAEVNQSSRRFSFRSDPFLSVASPGQDGAVGRNTFRAPGIETIDLAINKHFSFGERHKVELRSEIFNLLNRAHFGIPVHQLGFPGLGNSVETQLPMRTVQFALRYSF
jgi:hypothetical protein